MRLILVSFLCASCSLVNSTDDLRNDGGRSDGGGVDGGQVDVDPGLDADFDSGLDAGPCELPIVERLTVHWPSHPPLLRLRFQSAPTCTGMLSVEVKSQLMDDVAEFSFVVPIIGDGSQSTTFEYLGPQIPLIDAEGRMRYFVFGDREAVDAHRLAMPVERLQVTKGTAIFTGLSYQSDARVDIANTGDVVFESNQTEAFGGATTDQNVVVWSIDSEITPGGNIANVELIQSGAGFPVISDMGDAVAFIQGTNIVVLEFDEPDDHVNTIVDRGPPQGHLDLRNRSSGGHALLAYFDDGSNTGSSLFLSEGSGFSEPTHPGFVPGGPGTLTMASSTKFVVLEGTMVVEYEEGANVHSTYSVLNPPEGLPFATPEVGAACRCGDELCVGTDSYDVRSDTDLDESWQLISADSDLEHLLLRNKGGGTDATDSPYVLVEIVEGGFDLTVVNLDEFGMPPASGVQVDATTTSAALSPDGEWLVYTLRTGSPGTMEIYRIPVD